MHSQGSGLAEGVGVGVGFDVVVDDGKYTEIGDGKGTGHGCYWTCSASKFWVMERSDIPCTWVCNRGSASCTEFPGCSDIDKVSDYC